MEKERPAEAPSHDRFREVFQTEKPIIAMLHVWNEPLEQQIERTLTDLRVLNGLVGGVIVENYGWGYEDSLHAKAEAVERLRQLTEIVVKHSEIPVGLNVLPNDFEAALRIADQAGGQFIQMDHIVGQFENARSVNATYLEQVRRTHPDVLILGGIHPKYYELRQPEPRITDSAEKAAERGDAVVVTGTATGQETDLTELETVKAVLEHTPLVLGSGLNPDNAPAQLEVADGAIVGSTFKPEGTLTAPVDRGLVEQLVQAVK